MSFTASKLLWVLAQPGNLLLVILLAGIAIGWSAHPRRRAWGRRLATSSLLVLVAVAVLPLGEWALRPLEERFSLPTLPEHVDGIVVLGGSVDQVVTAARGIPVLTEQSERLVEFVHLARRYPGARLVATGGSGQLDEQALKEAPVVEETLRRLGIDTDRVLFEDQSRNTYENAILSKRLVDPQPGETWVLVTTAFHQPRAVGIFRAAGWPVIPYPVDYRTRPGYRIGRPALGSNLDRLETAAREWVGLVAYRLMGRTESLLPGP